MKKRIIIVCYSLSIGGIEKSLLSLLSSIDYNKYDVDLQLFENKGTLMGQIPIEVNILPELFQGYTKPFSNNIKILFEKKKLKLIVARLLMTSANKTFKNPQKILEIQWLILNAFLSRSPYVYDVSIGYHSTFCNYYSVFKVNSKRKIIFNHIDYGESLKGNWVCEKIENKCNSLVDNIITVSEAAYSSLINFFPEHAGKIKIMHNIISEKSILEKGSEYRPAYNEESINLLTVARLSEEKGIDLALESCSILKGKGYNVVWYIIGEGIMRKLLDIRIKELNLVDNFILLGPKDNPYPYIKECDLYVQPSRTESYGIAIVEAKIFTRPIVATNIDAFKNHIKDGETGILVDLDAESISNGISFILDNPNIARRCTTNLCKEVLSNETEINILYELM